MDDGKQRKQDAVDDAGGIDSYLDLDGDGKVSVSESMKAEAELLDAYAENMQRKGGFKGRLGGILSKFFKALDKK